MANLSLPLLVVIFLGAAAAVWWAGIRLSTTTDVLDRRLGLGDALGGLVILSVVTNLPDFTIVISAALSGHVGLATGTLLGAVSVQTIVLVMLDIAGGGNGVALTRRTKTLVPVLEATLVIVVLILIIAGSQLDPVNVARIEPIALAVVLMWIAGLLMVRKANAGVPWQLDARDDPGMPEEPEREASDASTKRIVAVFLFAAAITLGGGVVLERASSEIASQLGVSSVLFGATALAAATAIPDLSIGLQSVRLGDHQLVISKGFGSNAFLPTLFLLAGIVSGSAVVAGIDRTSVFFAALGVFLMCIYLIGLVLRGNRTVFRMGLDSLTVLIAYAIGGAVLLSIG